MALKPCPECGKEMSTDADACPSCGWGSRGEVTPWGMTVVTLGVLLVVVGGFMVASGGLTQG